MYFSNPKINFKKKKEKIRNRIRQTREKKSDEKALSIHRCSRDVFFFFDDDKKTENNNAREEEEEEEEEGGRL